MTAMFMLLDHSIQRLKDAAEPLTVEAENNLPVVRATEVEQQSIELRPLAKQFAHVEACLRESKRFLDDLTTVARTGHVHMEPARVESESFRCRSDFRAAGIARRAAAFESMSRTICQPFGAIRFG